MCLRKSITRICTNCHAVFIARTWHEYIADIQLPNWEKTCIKIIRLKKVVTNPEAGNLWSLFYTWYHFLVNFMSSVRMFSCLTCFFQTLVFPKPLFFLLAMHGLVQKGWTSCKSQVQEDHGPCKERGHRSKAAAQTCLQDKRMWHKTGTKKGFLLWLSLGAKEKSPKNEVLAFLRRLSQIPHLTVNLYLHEDLRVCWHIHQ